MNKPRKPTPNAKAFEREVKRLTRIVKQAEKRGITFLTSPIPEKPERVTKKQLRLISAIKPPDIYAKGFVVDQQTGEFILYKTKDAKKEQFTTKKPTKLSIPQVDIKKPRIAKKPRKPKPPKKPKARKPKPKLTPEQLHKIRVEAGKKAAETIRRRMEENPEYAKRMREIWREAGKKAAKTRELKKAEAELEEIRKTPRKEDETTNIPKSPYELTPEEIKQIEAEAQEIADTGAVVLSNVRSLLMSSINRNTAQYLLDLLEDEITQIGEEQMIERLYYSSERAIDLAQGVMYASVNEDLQDAAYPLALLICGGNAPANLAEEIEMVAYEDIPYKYKRLRL